MKYGRKNVNLSQNSPGIFKTIATPTVEMRNENDCNVDKILRKS